MTLIIETHPDPSAPFLFSKEERAEFERHGIKPFRHIIDDEYEKTDKLGTLTSITRVFDWRDDRDYLV
ncbi:MAG TPA: hypothetical protein VJP79_11710, partial [Nitrososphaera sp.]|nr:hypothetical protein [Nitrososphaera sp.]